MTHAATTPETQADVAPTPVPWRRVLTVGAVLLANHFSMLVVLPVVPFMVGAFFPASPTSQLGYYTGYLTTAFFLGQLLAAYGWGWAADRWGRRPILMAGLAGTAVAILLFGLSSSYLHALCLRFLWGLSNGNISVSKAYLSDILDPTNSARGFTIFGLQAAVGRLLGPPVGGWLSDPAALPAVTRTVPLFTVHPYLLPCAAASLLGLGCLALAFFCLPESLPLHRKLGKEAAPLIAVEEPVLRPALLISSALYCMLGVCHIGYEELFPLWVIMDHPHGGFGFSAAQLGSAMAFTGPALIGSQLLLVPWLTRRLCCRQAFRLAMGGLALNAFAAPLWSLAGRAHSPLAEAAAAAAAFMLLSVSTEAAYTFVFILINDSVPHRVRGRANGVAAVLVAVGRTAGTAVWGPLFSWSNSLSPDLGLLRLMLPFTAMSGLAVLAAALTECLPPSVGQSH